MVSTADAITGLTISNLQAGENLSLSVVTSGQAHYLTDGWSTGLSVDLTRSLFFTIENNTGSALNLNGISFLYKITNKGPKTGQFRFSLDGAPDTNFDNAKNFSGLANEYPADFDTFASVGLSALENGSTLTVYLVGFSASSSGNTAAQLANIRVYTTNFGGGPAVPEPSSFAMLAGLGAIGFAATRRRRRA